MGAVNSRTSFGVFGKGVKPADEDGEPQEADVASNKSAYQLEMEHIVVQMRDLLSGMTTKSGAASGDLAFPWTNSAKLQNTFDAESAKLVERFFVCADADQDGLIGSVEAQRMVKVLKCLFLGSILSCDNALQLIFLFTLPLAACHDDRTMSEFSRISLARQ
jgi:hypothetical protein